MEINLVKADEDFTHIELTGRVDLQGIGDLDFEFSKQTVTRKKPVLVDLSGVDFMASIGLRMLVLSTKALNRFGAKLVLLNPQNEVESVLRTSGFDQIMPISHDYDEAVGILTNSG